MDQAVAYFGRYIDSKLEEVDEKGKYKYSLKQLLWEKSDSDTVSSSESITKQLQKQKLKGVKGLFGKYVPRKSSR